MSSANLFGADTDALGDLGHLFETKAQELGQLTATISGELQRVEQFWQGSDAADFRNRWVSTFRPALTRAGDELHAASETIETNRQHQIRTSEADSITGPNPGTGPGGAGPDRNTVAGGGRSSGSWSTNDDEPGYDWSKLPGFALARFFDYRSIHSSIKNIAEGGPDLVDDIKEFGRARTSPATRARIANATPQWVTHTAQDLHYWADDALDTFSTRLRLADRLSYRADNVAYYAERAWEFAPQGLRTNAAKIGEPIQEATSKFSAFRGTARYATYANRVSLGLDVVSIGLDGYTSVQAFQEGDTEKGATYGLRAAGSFMMLLPFPGMAPIGGALVLGTYAYEYRDEIAGAATWAADTLADGASAVGHATLDTLDDIGAGVSNLAGGAGAALGRLW